MKGRTERARDATILADVSSIWFEGVGEGFLRWREGSKRACVREYDGGGWHVHRFLFLVTN